MSEMVMAVRSQLRVLLLERNTQRVRDGLEPWTVRGLAESIDISPSVITGLNSNRAKRVDFETLNKLCKALDCSPGDILVYSPDSAE